MLTAAQKTTLKAFLAGDSTVLSGMPQFNGTAVNAVPNSGDGNEVLRLYLNTFPSTDFFVWATAIPVQDIYNNITWANLTPTDDPGNALNTVWVARSLHCQGKQFNIQTILQGQQFINGSKTNIRAGLQDALTNVPSGVVGALLSAGWASVRDNALARKATKLEKLFANTAGGNGAAAATAALMVIEGTISGDDVADARNNG